MSTLQLIQITKHHNKWLEIKKSPIKSYSYSSLIKDNMYKFVVWNLIEPVVISMEYWKPAHAIDILSEWIMHSRGEILTHRRHIDDHSPSIGRVLI